MKNVNLLYVQIIIIKVIENKIVHYTTNDLFS